MSHTRTLLTPAQLESATDLIELQWNLVGWEGPTMAVGIISYDGNTIEAPTKPLGPHDPIEELVGFTAPDDWLAFGIVALGRAHSLDDPRWKHAVRIDGIDGEPEPDADLAMSSKVDPVELGRVRFVHMVGRDGRHSGVIRHVDGPRTVHPAQTGWGHGRVDDYCRRVLGLPTRPPAVDIRQLWTSLWLDSLGHAYRTGDRAAERLVATLGLHGDADRQRWLAAISQHEAVGMFLDSEPEMLFPKILPPVDTMSTILTRAANCFARVQRWDDLRGRVAESGTAFLGVYPDDAAWLDEGSFARKVLASVPPPELLLDDLRSLVPLRVHRRIRGVVASWEGPIPPRDED